MMQYYPAFTLHYIENMPLKEWKLRLQAHRFSILDLESVFYELPFIDRGAKATDKDGYYQFKTLKDLGIDLDQQRALITGQAQKKINQFIELDRRVKAARRKAREQLKQKRGGK